MHDASTALNQVADEVRKLGEAIGHEDGDAFAQRTQAWADALGQAAMNAASAANGIVVLSNEQIRALRSINEELQSGGLSLERYEERMAEVFTGVNAQIERQIEQVARLKSTEQDLSTRSHKRRATTSNRKTRATRRRSTISRPKRRRRTVSTTGIQPAEKARRPAARAEAQEH